MRGGWSGAAAAAEVAMATVARAEAQTAMEGETRREVMKVEGVMAVVA